MSRLFILTVFALLPLLLLPQEAEAGRVLHIISEISNGDLGSVSSLSADALLRWLLALLGLI